MTNQVTRRFFLRYSALASTATLAAETLGGILTRSFGNAGQTVPADLVVVSGTNFYDTHFPYAWAQQFPPADGVVGEVRGSRYLILECSDAPAADTALRTAAEGWKELQLSAARNPDGKWILRSDDGGLTTLEQQGRYVLAVSGEREPTDTLVSRLRSILGRK